MAAQSSDPSAGFPSTDGPPAEQAAQIAALEAQVAQAQAELEEYQRLLNELPGIYEDKFRQKVRSVAQEIRQLLDERKALQQQVERALAQPRQPEALPAAATTPVVARRPTPKTWADVRLPRFRPPAVSMPRFGCTPRRRWLGLGVAGVLVLVGIAAAAVGPWMASRRGSPSGSAALTRSPQATPPLPAATPLRLQARGGESWVLVQDLQGRVVLDAILQPGEAKELPLGPGLRVRSGRADLLFVAVAGAAAKPLGGVGDLDWVDFRP